MEKEKKLNKFEKELIKLFADKTGCNIQYNKCPCNRCFHHLDKNGDKDFTHICWLIILGLRGDYPMKEILNDIEKELK